MASSRPARLVRAGKTRRRGRDGSCAEAPAGRIAIGLVRSFYTCGRRRGHRPARHMSRRPGACGAERADPSRSAARKDARARPLATTAACGAGTRVSTIADVLKHGLNETSQRTRRPTMRRRKITLMLTTIARLNKVATTTWNIIRFSILLYEKRDNLSHPLP